jgi:hypothetical protein
MFSLLLAFLLLLASQVNADAFSLQLLAVLLLPGFLMLLASLLILSISQLVSCTMRHIIIGLSDCGYRTAIFSDIALSEIRNMENRTGEF